MATEDRKTLLEDTQDDVQQRPCSTTQPILQGTVSCEPNPNIQNIMITGGAGFIASWVVRHLTLTYPSYRIISFDKIDYCASLNNTKCLESYLNFQFVYGDITDQQAVLRCIRQYEVDTILHFAAMSHVDLSFGNSFAFTKTNVEGTHVLLEAAVKLGIKKFIHMSTDEVNGETKLGDPDLLEDSILAPTNPYAASKAAAEMYVNAYAKSFKLPCIIVRSNNVYGPHQYPEKIIPKFACLLDRGRPLILHGNGENTRRYLFAADAADAFDTILHKGVVGEIYNVGSMDEVSNSDLAHKMLTAFGIRDTTGWIQHTYDRPFNDMRYAVDARKLLALGWTQKMRLEEGLRITIQWYRDFGREWWREVEGVLTAFPEVREGTVWKEDDPLKPVGTPLLERQKERLNVLTRNGLGNGFLAVPGLVSGSSSSVGQLKTSAGSGASKKRSREIEGKENEDVEGAAGVKRVLLGDILGSDNPVLLAHAMIVRTVLAWLWHCRARQRTARIVVPTIMGEPVIFPMLLLLAFIWLLPHKPYPKSIQSKVLEHYRKLPFVKVDFHLQQTLAMRYPRNKTALYIEPRASVTYIAPLLLHMMEVVPPEWRFVFIGSEETMAVVQGSGSAARYEQIGRLKVTTLEKWAYAWGPRWNDLGIDEIYSRLLTNRSFYDEELEAVEHLFVFHSDAVLCANSEGDLNDWLHYDWVGAPWTTNTQRFGGDGGLSLRRVSKIREVLTFQERLHDTAQEDVWLSSRLGLLHGAQMAPIDLEKQFAVADLWYQWPMGYHVKPGGFDGEVWQRKDARKAIFDYCPEIKIIMDMRLERERCVDPIEELEWDPDPQAEPETLMEAVPVPITQEEFEEAMNGGPPSDFIKEHLKDLEAAIELNSYGEALEQDEEEVSETEDVKILKAAETGNAADAQEKDFSESKDDSEKQSASETNPGVEAIGEP